MSKPTSSGLARCRAAALDTAWSQWAVLGGAAGGRVREARAVVDPEALLLLSCALRDEEPRLWDFAAGLMSEAPQLLSVQRTRNLASAYPEQAGAALGEAAAIAVADGKDARWKPIAARTPARRHRPGKLSDPFRQVGDPAALMLRLRLAFGVHVRPDALAYLLASAPTWASAREVAEATGYGVEPARRALDAMAQARVVVAEGARPERYRVAAERWAPLLGTERVALWRHWSTLFAFLAAVLAPARAGRVAERSPYLLSGEQRRLVLAHAAAFARNRIAIPEPSDFVAEEYLEGFDRTLVAVAEWMEGNG